LSSSGSRRRSCAKRASSRTAIGQPPEIAATRSTASGVAPASAKIAAISSRVKARSLARRLRI